MELTVTCGGCGEEYLPDHSDYVRGTWRVCPACRDGPASRSMSHATESRTLSGPNNAVSSCESEGNEVSPP